MKLSTDLWNPNTYGQFLDARTRPAQDLLAAIPQSFHAERVIDLGCGPGNSTVILKERWPKAHITGLDSSSSMLTQAGQNYPDIEFIEADIANLDPRTKWDCIFSNAALQWLPDHERLIPQLLQCLNPNGFLAIQIPNNFHLASHQVTLPILEARPQWQALLKKLRYSHLQKPLYDARYYYDLLTSSEIKQVHIWETEYLEVLDNHEAIFNWVQGTGLRPILTELDQDAYHLFKEAYIKAVSQAYPLQQNGKVLFNFRRLFMVAHYLAATSFQS